MSWAILSFPTLEQWVLSSFCFSFFAVSFLVPVTNLSSFQLQPIIQEHKELVWLVGNLKLEVNNYLRELYGLGGAAYPGGGDNDDNGGEEKDSEATIG